jgi:hypothetical protein
VSNPGRGKRFSSSPKPSSPALWPPPPPQLSVEWVPDMKLPGPEVNHSPPSSAEVKNVWSSTSTPLICLHVVGREKLPFALQCSDRGPKYVGSKLYTLYRSKMYFVLRLLRYY